MKVYMLELDPKQDDGSLEPLLGLVSEQKRERIARIRKLEDARRVLYADLLARASMMEHTGLTNEQIHFAFNHYGKPELITSGGQPIHFNISHSGNWVVCAVDQQPVGIDVEQIRSVQVDGMARYFSEQERAQLQNTPPEFKLELFFRLWTLKESYLKAVGMGFHTPLSSFTILLPEDQGEHNRPSILGVESHYQLKEYIHEQQSVKIAVCASHDAFPSTMIRRTPQQVTDLLTQWLDT